MSEDEAARELAVLRTKVLLQARVCYMNVDRTLATWTRTALALIVFGTVVDRFGLLLTRNHLLHLGTRLAPNPLSSIGGALLVALGTIMVVAAAIRHQAYRKIWRRAYAYPEAFGPWLTFGFAVMTALVGLVILVIMLTPA
ncbi:MAG TPA: DUF202 domain-containing protein [Rhodanobacteraceae bacterium]